MSELSIKLIEALRSFSEKLERGDEIEMTELRRVQTPDGPLHLRKRVRMNDANLKRCIVCPIRSLRDHPENDSLQVAEVIGHQVVVGRHYDEGVLGVFIPDTAVIPVKLLDEMRLYNHALGKGRLGGKKGDRVKAREVQGLLSEGLFYGSHFYDLVDGKKVYDVGPSWNPDWIEGQDVTEELGVTFV